MLTLVARGLSNAEIAERLLPQPGHREDARGPAADEAAARDRAQLVVIAYETGLVTPSGP